MSGSQPRRNAPPGCANCDKNKQGKFWPGRPGESPSSTSEPDRPPGFGLGNGSPDLALHQSQSDGALAFNFDVMRHDGSDDNDELDGSRPPTMLVDDVNDGGPNNDGEEVRRAGSKRHGALARHRAYKLGDAPGARDDACASSSCELER